jgi:hypothetical protein
LSSIGFRDEKKRKRPEMILKLNYEGVIATTTNEDRPEAHQKLMSLSD